MTNRTELSSEWSLLQQHFYRYEQQALLIKLLAVVLTALAVLQLADWRLLPLLAILWLQEAMLRTWQARLADRSLKLEQALRASGDALPAWQLHSDWLASRPGQLALLRDYLGNALRPTVAFPYVVLVLFLLGLPMMTAAN
ncbi:hypothetical protein [Permianibacter fluminis]|uniref:hypothetical protein n=1 Tax=Permianibacter fluminis TaxID=2738515 RepID=UPI001B7D8A90|nr:hypothetical protein [Permianibacter fluminis]